MKYKSARNSAIDTIYILLYSSLKMFRIVETKANMGKTGSQGKMRII